MTKGPTGPPRLAEWLLGGVLPGSIAGRSIMGDLREEFQRRVEAREGSARRWYWRESMSVVFTTLRDGEMPYSWTPPREVSDAFRSRGRGDGMVSQVIRDIRYAIRALVRTPGFTAVAALTLALGIGANTAIFSVVNGVLLRPLPFEDPDELVAVRSTAPGLGYPDFSMSPGIFVQYREAGIFEEIALLNRTAVNVTGDGSPERVTASFTSRTLFPTLGVSPMLGRNFTEEEDLPEGPQVVVISHAVWQARYSGSRDVLGRTLQVDGVTREIVGIMPEGFGFPFENTQLWMPLAIDPATASPGSFGFQSIGRLKKGAELSQVRARLAQVVQRLRDDSAAQATQGGSSFVQFLDEGRYAPRILLYKDRVVGDLRRPLWILLGTVGFVLLIACANVANLFLVRAEARQREIAVRSALGASRSVLVRHFLAEGAVLAVLGGLAGLTLAWVGVPALLSLAPENLPRMDGVGMDAGVLGFTAGVTGLAVLLFGMMPVFRYTSPRLLATLKQGGRGTAGADRHAVRNLLVIAQTGMALVLLVGSGLLVRSFWEIRSIDPGFEAEDILTFRLTLPGGKYDTPLAQASFHGRLLDRLAALPGVESVGAVQTIPLESDAGGTAFDIEEFPSAAGTLPPILWRTFTTAGFFETMKIPLLAGRTFESRDHEEGSDAIVVSQALVERFWGDGTADVIGKRLRFSGDTLNGWLTIAGVVGSVRDRGLREEPSDMIYLPIVGPRGNDGWGASSLAYAIRGRGVESLGPAVRAQVWELDSDLPITTMTTMEKLVSDSLVRLSFTMLTLAISAGIALILGAVGLYGVLSYVVSQRTQEIGVRIALGAPVASVRKMVVMQGARLAAIGLGLGLLASVGLTRVLQGLLFDTEALDPLTFGGTSGLLMAVVFLASYLPARRASNVDPVQSMKTD